MYKIENVWKDWKIVRLIGEGSSGKVYEIVRDNMGIEEHSALKIITIPQSQAEARLLRNEGMDEKSVTEYFHSIVKDFIHEISIMSKLKGNPNVVAYEDYQVVEHKNEIGWDILIRMELLKPFSEFIGEKQPDENEVIELGIEMCEALAVCHKNNIIHRDIKYDNIFVSDGGIYKLGDFGVARTIEKTSGNFSIKGTYTYMAPEVYKGESYGTGADIYSLGMVLYRLLNGNREPFLPLYPEIIRVTDRDNALVKRMQGNEFNLPENASEGMSKIILKACAFNAKDRYSSVKEFKDALKSLQHNKSQIIEPSKSENINEISSTPISIDKTDNGVVENLDKPLKSKKLKIIIAVVIVTAVVLSGVKGVTLLIDDNKSDSSSFSVTDSTVLDSQLDEETEIVIETTDPAEYAKQTAYEEGLNLLNLYMQNLDEATIRKAIEKFEEADDYEQAYDYLTISKACLESDIDKAVDVLRSYADDEYVQKILLLDKYIYSFMKSSLWSGVPDLGTDSSYFLSFDAECYTDYNLPSYGYDKEENNDKISYYNFIDGEYNVFFSDNSSMVFWKFKILDENNIEVYCYETDEILYLYR